MVFLANWNLRAGIQFVLCRSFLDWVDRLKNMDLDTSSKQWILFGSVAIAAVSSLLFSVGRMNAFVPMPLHMVILAWTFSYGFVVVIPVIYMVEFAFLHHKKYFGKLVLIASVVFSILSVVYFFKSWEYGVKYRGESHSIIVAIENIVGFISLIVLAYLGVRRKSKVMQYAANLLLFLLLSWCVFPYLGESP